MKNRIHGPSFYYATDKNVFDALNQHKVDNPTVQKLFQRRNIVVSKKSSREDLARYFARLTHDYYDHKDIAARLGIAPRRERITSMDITGAAEITDLQAAIEQLKTELEASGDVVQVSREGDSLTMHVQYTTVDYKLSEFSQVQVRDGSVEFLKSADGYVVRNTHNDYLNKARETLLGKIEKVVDTPLNKIEVSLFDVPSAKLRSKFFHELVTSLPGYIRRDVTDVYVYKSKPDHADDDDEEDTDDSTIVDSDPHIERVSLLGHGVTQSELLNKLLDQENYYITKIGWTATEISGDGNVYDIEAVFSDPKDCKGFSFILSGVFPVEEGKVSKRRRAPHKSEIDAISRVIETKSRELLVMLREEFAKQGLGDA